MTQAQSTSVRPAVHGSLESILLAGGVGPCDDPCQAILVAQQLGSHKLQGICWEIQHLLHADFLRGMMYMSLGQCIDWK